jgi:copper chaperone
MSASVHKYEFDVKMTCGGCSGAIERVLERAKTEGVNTYNVDLGTQKVDVTGTISYDDLLAKIKKTGKEVRSGKTVVE